MESRWTVMDISGDAGIRAHGNSCREAFENAACGMYALITDLDKIEERKSKQLIISAISLDSLLVDFLNELIFLFDTKYFIGSRIEFNEFRADGSFYLKAVIHGEEFDSSRHEKRLLVKAATYHKLLITQRNGRCELEIIFDI